MLNNLTLPLAFNLDAWMCASSSCPCTLYILQPGGFTNQRVTIYSYRAIGLYADNAAAVRLTLSVKLSPATKVDSVDPPCIMLCLATYLVVYTARTCLAGRTCALQVDVACRCRVPCGSRFGFFSGAGAGARHIAIIQVVSYDTCSCRTLYDDSIFRYRPSSGIEL